MAKLRKSVLDGYKTYEPEIEGFGSTTDWKQAFSQRMGKDEANQILIDDNEEFDGSSQHAYRILELYENKRYDKVTIHAAFRRLIKKWHPDVNPSQPELAHKMTIKIIAAHSILT